MLRMRKPHVRQRPTSDFILATTAARILGRSAASIRQYAHSERLRATVTEEGVHLFSRCEVESLKRVLDAEQPDTSVA